MKTVPSDKNYSHTTPQLLMKNQAISRSNTKR